VLQRIINRESAKRLAEEVYVRKKGRGFEVILIPAASSFSSPAGTKVAGAF
jgi:hypothetical protein